MRHAHPRPLRRRRAPRRSGFARLMLLAALALPAGLATFGGGTVPDRVPVASVAGVAPARVVARADALGWMLDPARMPGAPSLAPAPRPVAVAEIPAATPPAPVRPSAVLAALVTAEATPLPVPRPPELALARPTVPPPSAATPRLAERPAPRRARPVVVASAEVENASFFDRLFGTRATPGTTMAYAGTGGGTLEPERRPALSPSPFSAGEGVAVYDITAARVTLPSGEQLEAHSGLGQHFDNPRFVHLRMRGSTPPGTYDLREREALFHGVRAIRMTPVGGSAAIHGRDGILAHTYMLGPRGDSNGCVSFRNYDRFLQAYLRGEVRRLVVVAGNGQDGPPNRPNRLFGSL